MHKKEIILFFVLVFCGQHLFAQEMKLASDVYTEHRYYPLRGKAFFKAYRQIKGNAYLTKDWVDGTIYLANGEILKSVKYKIDVYAHYLLVYNEYLKRVIILPRSEVKSFTVDSNNKQRLFKRVTANRNLKSMNNEFFLEVLKEGHISLYKLYFRDVTPLRTPEMPFIDEFVNGENYYIVYQGNWESVRLRRSSLNKQFPAYKDEIKQYTRTYKLKLKREEDFSQVIHYISQIVELVDHAKQEN